MSTQPFPNPKFQAFDSNGDPLAGGKLYTYSAGTTTPLASYTTRAGNVANANPVILDANGQANVWLTAGVDYKFVLKDSSDVVQWTVDNIPSPGADDSSSDTVGVTPGGRLTLTTATPVTTGDVAGAATIFYTLHKHDKIPLYDGSAWSLNTIASELSQLTSDTTKSPAAVAADKNYDMFVWDDSGTLRLSRGPAWSSDTARGTGAGTTELQQVNGRYVNKVSISNGPGAQRGLYVGTIHSDGSSQLNDTALKRHVWNTYNRVRRAMRRSGDSGSASSWTYTTATYRQANANAGNQLDIVCGLSEDAVEFCVRGCAENSSATHIGFSVGIGLDSTSVDSATSPGDAITYAAATVSFAMAIYEGTPGIGRHTIAWLEYSTAGTGTTTWRSGWTAAYSGMTGAVWA